ncbi:MAG: hypothetical protein HC862_04505 [Scytonema sp. RU_4_4]|nr:hypothetical protein [Scytonema sp. RU_4_4]NJR72799.1 hypothetical protein [Scytonema sp. CRU_2_7]
MLLLWNAISEQAISYQVLWTGVALIAKSSLQEIAKNAHSFFLHSPTWTMGF